MPLSSLDRLWRRVVRASACLFALAGAPTYAAAPDAFDVFASALKSTVSTPLSSPIVFDAIDADQDTLTYSVETLPSNGSLGAVDGSSVLYTPQDGFIGVDSFTYSASDGSDSSAVKTVSIRVVDPFEYGLLAGALAQGSSDLLVTDVELSNDGRFLAVFATATVGGGGLIRFVFGQMFRFDESSRSWKFLNNANSDLSTEGQITGRCCGTSMAFSADGTTVAIGDSRPQDGSDGSLPTEQTPMGRVKVFRAVNNPVTGYAQLGSSIDGPLGSGQLGSDVALSRTGDIIAVGEPGINGARVFQFSDGSWSQLGSAVVGEDAQDGAGEKVSLSADGYTVAFSSTLCGSVFGKDRVGYASVHRFDGSDWQPLGQVVRPPGGECSGLDLQLSADGLTLVNVGEPGSTPVYYFDEVEEDWLPYALTSTATQFDLSYDGKTLLERDTTAQRSYRLRDGVWQPDTLLLETTGPASLSADGTIIAVGDISLPPRGGALVFQLESAFEPTATDIFASVFKSTAEAPQMVEIPLVGADLNTTDIDYTLTSSPANGSLGSLDGAAVPYTPDNEFVGSDSFLYTAGDGQSTSPAAQVNVQVYDQVVSEQLGASIFGAASSDAFGTTVALSANGMVMAVGAPFVDTNGNNAGQVSVFNFIDGSWVPRGAPIDGESAGERFGTFLALSANGQSIVVGTPASGPPGDVRVYDFNGSSWVQRGQSIEEIVTAGQGGAVGFSHDGQTLLLATARWSRVYQYRGNRWEQLGGNIFSPDPDDFSAETGAALSADGLTVAHAWSDSGVTDESELSVYRYINGAWIKLGNTITESIFLGGTAGQRAPAVALSDDGTAVAFGISQDSANGDDAGVARVYDLIDDAWVQRGLRLNGGELDLFGSSVSLSGDGQMLAVGAPGFASPPGPSAIYRFEDDQWVLLAPGIDLGGESKREGNAIALSQNGQIVALGASAADSNKGRVRVFRLSNSPPVLAGTPPSSITVPDSYGPFVPILLDEDPGDTFTFALENGPGWLEFDPATGMLGGSPGPGDVGDNPGIRLSVTDSLGREGELPLFSINVLPEGDSDGDGLTDSNDNCPENANADQEDLNGDGEGDICDDDDDGDGLLDTEELELGTDPRLADSDGDGFTDGEEVEAESDPLSAEDVPDTNGLNIIIIKAAMDANGP